MKTICTIVVHEETASPEDMADTLEHIAQLLREGETFSHLPKFTLLQVPGFAKDED